MNGTYINSTLMPALTNFSATNASSLNGTGQDTTSLPPFSPSINDLKIYTRVIYIIVLVTGLIGNLLTCFVIISRSDMRRSIHLYTFNLATTDLILIALYLPIQMVLNESDLIWTMGDGLCRISYSIVSVTIFSTIGTLVAITMDRHRGVISPFSWRENARSVARLAVPAIWVIAIIFSVPLIAVVSLIEDPPGSGFHYCVETWSGSSYRGFWVSMFCIQFIFPLLVIIVAHAHIIYRIFRDVDRISSKHNKRMIRMIIVLALVYTFCTFPQHLIFFWTEFGNLIKLPQAKFLFLTANSLMLVQACINPVIYGTLRRDFKRSFKSLLMCSRFQTYMHRKFGVWGSIRNYSVTEPSSVQARRQEDSKKTVEVGLRKVLDVYRLQDTPPLERLYETGQEKSVEDSSFKLQMDTNSSSDSGISTTLTGNPNKKSVSFLLVPNGTIDTNASKEVKSNDNPPTYYSLFKRNKSGSLYDALEDTEESFGTQVEDDIEEMINRSKETDL